MNLPSARAFVVTILLTQPVTAQKFDPYQLNGGLVAAVAGQDFVLIASDTRLTDGGYGIHSRRYLSGRLWSASSSTSLSAASSTQSTSPTDVSSLPPSSSSTILTRNRFPAQWESDGSLVMPSSDGFDIDSGSLEVTRGDFARTANLPIMIGSAGCAADCEALKRRVRLELDALACSCATGALGVRSVANLLQQILYGRRGFPFYSFCVVAGIDPLERRAGCGAGAVYVYDAIGSYERVAVASAGTGRELLQPILDRLFSGPPTQAPGTRGEGPDEKIKESMAVSAGNQRMGVAGSLRPPVRTTVTCSWEEAVDNVARAYRSVAEREISVGDEIVICVVNTSKIKDGSPVSEVFSYPLKKH